MFASPAEDAPKLTAIQAAGVLLGLLVILAIYLYAAYRLGLAAIFAGNVVLFYWGSVEKFRMEALSATVVGALGGIANAAMFSGSTPVIGAAPGLVIAVLLLLAGVYFILMGWLRLLFNNAYLLMVNVVLIPPVLEKGGFIQMAVAVVFSAMFWGGLVAGALWIGRRRARTARA